jgi:RNA polymerase sigma factor (sigma-70 family)
MVEDVVLIIQRCLAGDEEAWNTLHREYSGIAIAFLRWKFPAIIDDHDDIIQKAFTNLLSAGLMNFKGTTKYEFLSYFKTIVRNEALRCIDDQKRRRAGSLHNEQSESKDGPPILEIPDPDAGSRPDRKAEAREMMTLLAKTLKEFALIDQEVYLLKLRGHMDKEVSAILDIPMGTVAVKYARIKNKLREKYEGLG